MNDQYTLCRCGKVRFTSWRAALRNARGIMRQRQAAGFAPRHSPEVERFKRLPPEVQRAALEFIEKVRVPA